MQKAPGLATGGFLYRYRFEPGFTGSNTITPTQL